MPIKWKGGFTPEPAPEPEKSSSFLDTLKGLVPSGIRIGSGILSSEGGFLGAGISGGGEALAELAEGQIPDWKRVAVEGGIGAIPLGKVFKAGKVVSSALKSGALSGASEAAREIAKGEDLSAGHIATSAGVGGLTGGALAKLLGLGAPKAVNAIEDEVVPTTQMGRGTGVQKSSKGGLTPAGAPSKKLYDTGTPLRLSKELPYRMAEPPATIPTDLTTEVQGVPYASNGPAPYRKAAIASEKVAPNPTKTKVLGILDKQFGAASTARDVEIAAEQAATEKAAKEAADLEEVTANRQRAGLTEPHFSSTSTVTAPGEKFTTQWTSPAQEAEGGAETVGKIKPKAPVTPAPEKAVPDPATTIETGGVQSPPPTPEVPETPLGKVLKVKKPRTSKKTVEGFNAAVEKTVEGTPPPSAPVVTPTPAPAPSTPGVLARFFKTRKGATGLNYRQATEAAEKGENVNPLYARDQHLIESGKAAEGPLKAEASTPDWIQRENDFIDQLKSETGEINLSDPMVLKAMTGLAGAASGGLIGAANSDEDNKLQGGLAGAAIGGGLGFGIPGAINVLKNPELIEEGMQKAGKLIPSIQRANLLTSSYGLPANAVAGPYGSAVTGAIEKGLSGDSRGWAALKNLGPINFLKHLKPNFNEARGLIGRAEGTALDAAATPTEKILAIPGTAMTTGDLTGRQLLEEGGGFLPAETREMTATNEPWSAAAKRVANLSKGSPLLQFMFPFSRTTANLAEQGAARTPGLGFFAHRAMEKGGREADTLRAKLVQQAMGAGAMGVGGAVGANIDDPESARIAQKFVSNGAGLYSLPASIGFAAGRALNQGKPMFGGGMKELVNALPLPTTRPLQDVATGVSDLGDFFTGEKDLTDIRVPHSMYPGFIRDMQNDSSLPSLDFSGEQDQQPVPQIRWRNR